MFSSDVVYDVSISWTDMLSKWIKILVCENEPKLKKPQWTTSSQDITSQLYAAFNPNKPEKLQVVFDCTIRYKGTSLNDQPLSGPDLTNNLLGVVLRILQEPVPLSSGIEAIFHQVMVDPNDVDTLWFLWWPDDDLSKAPVEYTFLVARLHQVFERRFNELISTVLKNFCMDDCFKSVQPMDSPVNWEKIFVSYCQEVDFNWS